MKKRRLYFIGEFRYPAGDAYSPRALNLCQILKLSSEILIQGRALNVESGNHYGIKFENLKNPLAGFPGKLGKILMLPFWGIISCRRLFGRVREGDILLVNSCSMCYLIPYLFLAKKKKCKLIVDVVEWYDYSSVPLGKFGPFAGDVAVSMKYLISKSDAIISISSFLKDYYGSRGKKTIRIPQVVDLAGPKWNTSPVQSFDPAVLNLIYAGVPGKKDLIGNIIEAVRDLNREGRKIKLHLLGPTPRDIVNCTGLRAEEIEEMQKEMLVLHGRINQELVPGMLSKADFSVLLRPDKRYAHAGFPTKLVESFAAGVPMIANLTGDIGLYLRDGENGFIVADWTCGAMKEALLRALSLTAEERLKMKSAARREAERSFDYRNYIESLLEFIDEVAGRDKNDLSTLPINPKSR